LVADSANPDLTGVYCINIADTIADTQIETIFEAAACQKV